MKSSWGSALWKSTEDHWWRRSLRYNWWPRSEGVMPKELRLGTMKKAYGRLLVDPSYSRRKQCFEDASTVSWPQRTVAAVEYWHLKPRRPGVCYKGQSWRNDTNPWRNPEDCEWTTYIGQLEFKFAFDCDCALIIFCFEGRKYVSETHS